MQVDIYRSILTCNSSWYECHIRSCCRSIWWRLTHSTRCSCSNIARCWDIHTARVDWFDHCRNIPIRCWQMWTWWSFVKTWMTGCVRCSKRSSLPIHVDDLDLVAQMATVLSKKDVRRSFIRSAFISYMVQLIVHSGIF